ncbi:MAG: response regulator [Chloroflexota bacterium]|jgi:CheY-like chemotaxis protein
MQKILVLVIDDDPVISRLVKLMLGMENYEVLTSISVPEAFSIMETSLPDIICCDLMMPNVNGLDFLKQRQTMPAIADIPVVIISGVGKQDWFDKAEELGAAVCLAKPFNAQKLIDAIKFALTTSLVTVLA